MFLRSILALTPALILPLCAAAQVVMPDSDKASAKAEPAYKYEVYAGFGYTSINQVTLSRHGLAGVDVSVTRDWGRYFGLSGLVNYYKPEISFGTDSAGTGVSSSNPGDPSVYQILGGPELHATLYGNLSGFFRGGIGIAHTGGEGMNPDTSFAGGFGGGMTYSLTSRLAIRAGGDRIGAAFPVNNNPKGFSTHRTWNASGTIGVVYRF